MLLEGFSEWIGSYFGRFQYSAPFVVLFLCGFCLPIPEEVTLIGCGLLLYEGEVEFLRITLVCSAAILLGDSVPFWLGRRYGMSALESPRLRRILHPERLTILQAKFKAHVNKTTFFCRFFAGVRIPGYFLAGTMGMSYPRFLLLDSLGVLISVPASIYLGKLFGDSRDQLKEHLADFHLTILYIVLGLIVGFIIFHQWRKRRRLSKCGDSALLDQHIPTPAPASSDLSAKSPDAHV